MSFKPTLRVLVDQQALDEANERTQGIYTMADFCDEQQWRVNSWTTMQDIVGLPFRYALVEDLVTGERVRNFSSEIVGRFTADIHGQPTTCLKLATGDVVAAHIDVV